MDFKELLDYVLVGWPIIAAVAAVAPTPVNPGVLMAVRKVLDVVALNVGNAKNEKK